jgi:hypothetical protein
MESGVRELEQAQRTHGTEGNMEPDVALDENITNQAHNQVNNNENCHVADKTQPVMAPPEILGAPHDDQGGRAWPSLHRSSNRGRDGSRRRRHPLPFRSQPAATVGPGVHESDSDQRFAARMEVGVRELEQAHDYQAYNNDSHSVVDASVGDVANIGAVENIEHHEANNDDDNYVVNAPINVADIAEVAAVAIITTQANNDDDNHDEVNAPGDVSITAVAAFNHGPLDEANVETITEDNNENYAVGNADNEQAQDSTHINRLLQSLSQQLWEKDKRINALEDRINHLEEWKASICFPYCTDSFEFSMNDSMSRVGEDNELQLDDGKNSGNDTGKKTLRAKARLT